MLLDVVEVGMEQEVDVVAGGGQAGAVEPTDRPGADDGVGTQGQLSPTGQLTPVPPSPQYP